MTDKIPPVRLYQKYLNTASIRFNMTLYQCRDKFGVFTEKQWNELFKN